MRHSLKNKEFAAVLTEAERSIIGSGIPVTLNPGLTPQGAARWFSRIRLQGPEDFKSLYLWKDGCSGPATLLPGFQFMRFCEVAAWMRSGAFPLPYGCLPVFTNGGGDFLYLRPEPNRYSRVFSWVAADPKQDVPAYDSLLTLFKTLRAAYEANAFRIRTVRADACTPSGKHQAVVCKITEAKCADTWISLVKGFNPRSARTWMRGHKLSRLSNRPQRLIAAHLEELDTGKIQTKANTQEQRKELEEIDYLLSTNSLQLQALATGTRSVYRKKLQDAIRKLKLLRLLLRDKARRQSLKPPIEAA